MTPESDELSAKQSKHMAAKHDGREVDILEVFFWPFFVGGEHDGKRVPGGDKSWKKTELTYEGDPYVRHRYHGAGFPGRIYYWADPQIPKDAFEPYIVARRILNTHQDIVRLPDITWDKSKPRPKDTE
jgi:hypothetical protein